MVPGGSPCLISMLKKITNDFSASEHAESLLGPVFGGGTVNPHRLANTCRSGISHRCALTISSLFFSLMKKKLETMFDNMQEPIDVRAINWRENEASMEGTQALRYLV